jgi:hypothetical protein
MTERYYELEDDLDMEGRWYLNGISDKEGIEFDSRDFTYGKHVDVGPPLRLSLNDEHDMVEVTPPLKVSLRRKGKSLDFTYADFDMPVVTAAVGQLLADIAGSDIQRIAVRVGSRKEEYDIINIISCVPCIDTKRSEIEWWTREDERPDKIGKPRMITRLVINQKSVSGANIFRPEGWEVVVVVSDKVRKALQEAKVTGVRFRNV